MKVLDANALYWYIGVYDLGFTDQGGVNEEKLRSYLDMQNVLYIPSSVYIEVVTHFRSQPDKLRIIHSFLENKNIKVVNNTGDYFCTTFEISRALTMCDSDLKEYANMLLKKKINIEVSFILSFAEIMRLLYLEYLLRIGKIDEKNGKNTLLDELGRKAFINDIEKIKAEFTSSLTDGYNQNNEGKVIQDTYIKYLEDRCYTEKTMVDTWLAYKSGKEDLFSELKKSSKKILSKLARENGVMRTIHATVQNDKIFLEEAKSKITQMFVSHHYSPKQAQYLHDIMLSTWFDTSQKLKKNDIFDMLCAGALDFKDPEPPKNALEDRRIYLITFDETMRNFIRSVCPYNDKLIERFVSK